MGSLIQTILLNSDLCSSSLFFTIIRLCHPSFCILITCLLFHINLVRKLFSKSILSSFRNTSLKYFKFIIFIIPICTSVHVTFPQTCFLTLYSQVLNPIFISLATPSLFLLFSSCLTKVFFSYINVFLIVILIFKTLHILTAISVVSVRILVLPRLIRIVVGTTMKHLTWQIRSYSHWFKRSSLRKKWAVHSVFEGLLLSFLVVQVTRRLIWKHVQIKVFATHCQFFLIIIVCWVISTSSSMWTCLSNGSSGKFKLLLKRFFVFHKSDYIWRI